MTEKGKDTIDISILYQVASDRLNLISQQAQTAISISAVSIMAFGATIGAIFASIGTGSDQHKVYADMFIIIVSVIAILVSFFCREILNRSVKVQRIYAEALRNFECDNGLSLKPHQRFDEIWNEMFDKYEPYKIMSWLMLFSMILYSVIIIAVFINLVL